MYECKILLDSISETNKRITTFQITFPRCVLAEAETHRVLRGWGGNIEEFIIKDLGINVDENLSRNSASSRAIPIEKMVQRVKNDPFIPMQWGKPVAGMGAKEYWRAGSDEDMQLTRETADLMHEVFAFIERNKLIANKEDLNRYLEPFLYHTAIITATEWNNFFKLRTAEGADWKIRKIASLMYDAYHAFDNVHLEARSDDGLKIEYITDNEWSAIRPQKLKVGEWHCPLVSKEDGILIEEYIFNNIEKIKNEHRLEAKSIQGEMFYKKAALISLRKKISVARCARISYLTHDGKRDISKDLELFKKLKTSGHYSPFEHVCTPSFTNGESIRDSFLLYKILDSAGNIRNANLWGWKQMRQDLPSENCINFKKEN